MAATSGNLKMLQWLRGQEPPCPWDAYTCQKAAAAGHLEVLKWLRSQEPPYPWDVAACLGDARPKGHANVVDWLEMHVLQ